jgi:hypothetical protein
VLAFGPEAASVEMHTAATDPAKVGKTAKTAGAALGRLLGYVREKGADQLVISRSWAEAAGLPADEGLAHHLAHDAAGWKWDRPGELHRSMRARHESGGRPVEVLLACYDPSLGNGEDTAEAMAKGLALVREITAGNGRSGFAYRHDPGSLMLSMWEAMARDGRALEAEAQLAPADFPAPAHMVPEAAADLGWMRSPTPAELTAKHCIVIDGNSQYLRAMAGLAVGIGKPELVTSPSFDKRPGYWQIGPGWQLADWPATLPAPSWPLAVGAGGWLTSETLRYLIELGAAPQIEAAWLWEPSRALERLQRRLRDALAAAKAAKLAEQPGADLALGIIKGAYKQGVGRWSRRDDRSVKQPVFTHRPHWRHELIARSTALLLRDLARIEAHPVAIATDAFAILTDLDAGELGLKLGAGLGQYDLERVIPAAPMLAALAERDAAEAAGERQRLSRARAAVLGLITGRLTGG